MLCSQHNHLSQLHNSFILSPLYRRPDPRALRNITLVTFVTCFHTLLMRYSVSTHLFPLVPAHPSAPAISTSRLHEAVVGGARQGLPPTKSFEIYLQLASKTRTYLIVLLKS